MKTDERRGGKYRKLKRKKIKGSKNEKEIGEEKEKYKGKKRKAIKERMESIPI